MAVEELEHPDYESISTDQSWHEQAESEERSQRTKDKPVPHAWPANLTRSRGQEGKEDNRADGPGPAGSFPENVEIVGHIDTQQYPHGLDGHGKQDETSSLFQDFHLLRGER